MTSAGQSAVPSSLRPQLPVAGCELGQTEDTGLSLSGTSGISAVHNRKGFDH